ncbi:MAG: calcium/sodium antiporter [Saccharofermentans sp.]|nr:calcium/sodium antiporter [Saccharofermentans sp.]
MTEILIPIALVVVGFVLLMKGADWFVEGAAKAALRFGIPQIIIGLTVVALGTSLPEAAVSINSAIQGASDLSVGNILGSNIINVLLILGITSLICVIPVTKKAIRFDIPLVVIITVLLSYLALSDNLISRIDGAILIAIMILYVIFLGYRVKKGDELEEIPGGEKKMAAPLIIFLIILGGAMIAFGSHITVKGAVSLATRFGVSERIIGLTMVAFGTSLPELVTSITAARKKETDIAIGNIVGSNFFNIVFVLGVTSLIRPIPCDAVFKLDACAAIATITLLFLCALPKKKLSKFSGVLMLICYTAYLVFTFVR